MGPRTHGAKWQSARSDHMTFNRRAKPTSGVSSSGVSAALIGAGLAGCGARSTTHAPSPAHAMGKPGIARLVRVSAAQYGQIVSDVFGPTIVAPNSPNHAEARISGLLAIGASQVSLSPAEFSAAHDLAEGVADGSDEPGQSRLADSLPSCESKTAG